jgi:signal recognition particle subunit SRP54
MGGGEARLNIPSSGPCVMLLCGLQGAGKTTHAAKLGRLLKKKGHRPLLVACDVYRPAAIKQLQIVGQQAGVPVFEEGQGDPIRISKDAVRRAKDYGNDFVLIDTAGRLQIDDKLMDELKNIKEAVHPNEILLVVDSMTGQEAVNVAKSFDEKLDITGVILTKLDGDTRGGAALSVKAVTGKPIKFAGVGEKLDDIEVFHPDRMASRILGMGDVLTLIEDAQTKLDEKQAEKAAKRMLQNKLDFNDLLAQFDQIKKMGPIRGVLEKIGMDTRKLSDSQLDDRIVDREKAIILSMTPQEREKPSLINPSHKRRIAAGSGTRVEDVNKLLRSMEQMQKLMKRVKGKKGRRRFMPPMNMPGMPGGMPFN